MVGRPGLAPVAFPPWSAGDDAARPDVAQVGAVCRVVVLCGHGWQTQCDQVPDCPCSQAAKWAFASASKRPS